MSYRRPYYSRTPRSLRRPQTQMDNIALVPASQLASLTAWQQTSQGLPAGDLVVVAQSDNLRLLEVGRRIEDVLKQKGRSTHMMMVDE